MWAIQQLSPPTEGNTAAIKQPSPVLASEGERHAGNNFELFFRRLHFFKRQTAHFRLPPPLPSALTGHASCPHLTLVPATTPPTASGPLVAATAGPAASLPVSGTPSAARWLPPAHGHLGVRLGWGEWLDPHPF